MVRGTRNDFVKMPLSKGTTLCYTGMRKGRQGYRLICWSDGRGFPKNRGWEEDQKLCIKDSGGKQESCGVSLAFSVFGPRLDTQAAVGQESLIMVTSDIAPLGQFLLELLAVMIVVEMCWGIYSKRPSMT